MPALQTHYTFAKVNAVNKDRKHFGALVLGSQGPDPLFFVGQLPWIKRKNPKFANVFGSSLHHRDFSDLYYAMIEYALQSEHKELLFDFIEGIFMHYVMDRNCHPYVFSVTGYDVPGDEKIVGKYYMSYHTRIESAIDMIYAGANGLYNKCPLNNLNLVSDSELMEISKMWYVANEKTFKYENVEPDTFYLGVKDYINVMKFLNNCRWFKRWFVKTFIGEYSSGYALIYPKDLKKRYGDVDFMNEKKESWPDPVSGEERNESFMELVDNAKREYIDLVLPLLEKAKTGENVLEEMHAFYNGLDHDGTKDNQPKVHMKPFFPYTKK